MKIDPAGQERGVGCGKAAQVNSVWTYLLFKSMKIHRFVTVFNVLKYQQE